MRQAADDQLIRGLMGAQSFMGVPARGAVEVAEKKLADVCWQRREKAVLGDGGVWFWPWDMDQSWGFPVQPGSRD